MSETKIHGIKRNRGRKVNRENYMKMLKMRSIHLMKQPGQARGSDGRVTYQACGM
jgi:hypothetical protein